MPGGLAVWLCLVQGDTARFSAMQYSEKTLNKSAAQYSTTPSPAPISTLLQVAGIPCDLKVSSETQSVEVEDVRGFLTQGVGHGYGTGQYKKRTLQCSAMHCIVLYSTVHDSVHGTVQCSAV